MSDNDFVKNLMQAGLEFYGKYYSLYPGIVSDNADPQSQGRVRVSVPALGRDEPLIQWAYPVAPFAGKGYGFFFPPEVGDRVWVMFEGGNPDLPNYIGGWFGNPSKGPSTSEVPSEASPRGGAPVIRELKTPSGHRLIFDDTSGAGSITIQSAKGSMIKIDDSDGSLKIIATGPVTVQATEVKVEATAASVAAQAVNINGVSVRINNGTKFAAAIGDSVQGAGQIQGPPTGMRPLIP